MLQYSKLNERLSTSQKTRKVSKTDHYLIGAFEKTCGMTEDLEFVPDYRISQGYVVELCIFLIISTLARETIRSLKLWTAKVNAKRNLVSNEQEQGWNVVGEPSIIRVINIKSQTNLEPGAMKGGEHG